MRDAIDIIWQLATVAGFILAARLLVQGLAGVYPALMAGSCFSALQSVLLILSASPSRSPMREAWRFTMPIDWLANAWIVFELFSKWSGNYRGIGRFGKYLFGTLIGFALLASLLGWPFEWKALVFAHDFRIYYIVNRVLLAAFALFTFFVWLFFRNYPAAVAPNVVQHTRVTLTYFGVIALCQLAFTLIGLRVIGVVNLLIVGVTAGCFSAWAVTLTRVGEYRASIPAMATEDIEKIERVNRELLGLMKNFPG